MGASGVKADDERALVVLAARGDRDAFGLLYERHVHKVYRHVYYLTNDPEAAEDLTAQTFLRALQAIPTYEVRGVPFQAWLLRIAYNLTVNHRKAQRNNGHAPLPERVEGLADTVPSDADDPQADVEPEKLWGLVRKLRDDQRQVIVMRFADGLSYKEVAQALGKTVGAVRVIQYRALMALRRSLERDCDRYHLEPRPR